MAKKKKQETKKAKVHKDLDGLDLSLNNMGQVESTVDVDKINKFLDKNVKDKKLENDVKKEGEDSNK